MAKKFVYSVFVTAALHYTARQARCASLYLCSYIGRSIVYNVFSARYVDRQAGSPTFRRAHLQPGSRLLCHIQHPIATPSLNARWVHSLHTDYPPRLG